jgi:protein-disulfide isomerase
MIKKLAVLAFALLLLTSLGVAQDPSSVLKPPAGSHTAIVVFEDLQCPQCGRTAPLIKQAVKTYKIPLEVYDFPLPMHNWSYNAAIFAHYFDSKSKQLGFDFRDYIFANQMQIYPANLREFVEKFAAAHQMALPFVVDPQGKLAAEITASKAVATELKVDQTPTVYIVSDKGGQNRAVHVNQPQTELFQTIDAMK